MRKTRTHCSGILRVAHLLFLQATFLLFARFATAQVNIVTYHNDNAHTGQNLQETILTRANVNPATFGKLFILPVDGVVYAQPLYLSHVAIPGQGTHNVVFVATEHDSVYAFDADNPQQLAPLWKVNLIPSGGITVSYLSVGSVNIVPEIGITGTPVIDPISGTLYVVARTVENGQYVQRLHALDVHTGSQQMGSPVTIQASFPGSGNGTDGMGHIPFDSKVQNQRSALVLHNGVIYISWASHADNGPYHGWIIGYDAVTLQQVTAFNTTPNTHGGGIWASGSGPSVDASGNLFVTTANGTFDAFVGGNSYSDTFLKLAPYGNTFQVLDYFTPQDQGALDQSDADLGSGGTLLLPDQNSSTPHLMTSAGKEGVLYLVNRDTGSMGRYNTRIDNIVQSFYLGNGVWGSGAYYNGTIYYGPLNQPIQAYTLQSNPGQPSQLVTPPASHTNTIFAYPGATPSISANGNQEAILWAIEGAGTGTAILHAYDAANIASELYNSAQVAGRDDTGGYVVFSTPMVANGKVYLGTQNSVAVFGLGDSIPSPTIHPDSGTYYPSVSVTITDIIPGGEVHYTTDGSAPSIASPLYTGPFTVASSAIVQARNFKAGAIPSVIVQASYVIDAGEGNGDGLTASYYNNGNLVGTPITQVDPNIDFTWNGAPVPGITAYPWSATWTGKIQPRYTADTTLTVYHGGGVNLFINGQVLIGRLAAGPETSSVVVHFVGGQPYDIRIEYRQFGSIPQLQLYWSDATRPQEIIPQSQLYTGATLIVPPPQFVPWSGSFYPTETVTLTDTLAGTEIHYTTDGTAPSKNSTLYTGPFTLSATATVKAIAFKSQYTDSTVSSATYTYTPALAKPVYSIDCGSDVEVPPFILDNYFVGGGGHTRFGLVDTHLVSNPAPEAVYQSERIGNFSYVLPNLSPGTSYLVRLHFAENLDTAPGQRVFNVAINGQPVLTNFDIIATVGGQFIALVKEFPAVADASGAITIQFTSVVDLAKVNAIEILATAPPAPTNLTATAGVGQVGLNWTAAGSADAYNIKRSLTNNGPYTTVATAITATAYTDATVTNGTTYYYVVSATNAAGESSNSNQASAIPLPLPTRPTNLTAVAGDAKVYISWVGSTANSTTFTVLRTEASGGIYTPIATNLTIANYTDTNVTNGTTYYYQIIATNPVGITGSSSVGAIPMPGLDGTGLTGYYYWNKQGNPLFTNFIFSRVDPVMNFQISVNGWPSSIVAPTYFSVKWFGKLKVPFTGLYTLTTLSDDGVRILLNNQPVLDDFAAHIYRSASGAPLQLIAGQIYDIEIDFYQNGDFGAMRMYWAYPGQAQQIVPTQFLYPLAPPSAPMSLTATAGAGQVGLNWSGSIANGATFNVKRSLTDGGPYTTVATGITATAYTDTTVTNGTIYYYVVSATNAAGEGSNSNQASATPLPLPVTPTNLTAVTGDAKVYLSWTGSTANSTTFAVLRGLTGGGPYTTIASGLTNTAYVDTNVTNGTTYYYQIAATNPAGKSRSSETSATPLPSDGALRINCGGDAIGYFAADEFYSDSTTTYATSDAVSTANVLNTAPSAVYQSQRVGDMTYTIPGMIPGVPYRVRLHFAELIEPMAGSRVFNVTLNDETVLFGFDILQEAGGPLRAVVKDFVAQCDSSGTLTISFTSLIGQAVCSGIEIAPVEGTLCGTLDLVGIDPAAQAQTITFQFRLPGSTPLVQSASVGPDGKFCLTGLPSKDYNVWIKGKKYLAQQIHCDLSHGAVLDARATLLPGDVNNDNEVDVADIGVLINAYGSSADDMTGNYLFEADLDGDGKIDISDLGLIVGTYGLVGDP